MSFGLVVIEGVGRAGEDIEEPATAADVAPPEVAEDADPPAEALDAA
jgi:hypothetical protein